jgi:SAM-dependent methyltransferase
MSSNTIQHEKGSFRDPSGYVFYCQGEIYRVLDESTFSFMLEIEKKGLLNRLKENGYIIPTELVHQGTPLYKTLKDILPHERHFLHHMKVPVISYPYEWTFSMLADAAKLQLSLQLELIEEGFSLKDSSAFNVQFIHCKPVFIDILSIEKPRLKNVWIAYGQFCQMHLFPLLLKRYGNIGLKNYFMGNIDGLSVEEVFRILGFFKSMRPALFIDVFLQSFFQSAASKKTPEIKKKLEQGGSSTAPQVMNIKRMIRKIDKLMRENKHRGYWKEYVKTKTYSAETELEKVNYLKDFLQEHSPGEVLDLGSNTGQYSLLASRSGADVIAIDSDHDCVDLLYQQAKKENAKILPLWVDIANPSPALGFCHQERKSFMERIKADAVFALALIHHMLITSRIPLPAICDFFYDLTKSYMVIEFVGRRDEMFQQLLALREDIYGDISRESFLETFSKKFELVREQKIAKTQRVLFTFRKK